MKVNFIEFQFYNCISSAPRDTDYGWLRARYLSSTIKMPICIHKSAESLLSQFLHRFTLMDLRVLFTITLEYCAQDYGISNERFGIYCLKYSCPFHTFSDLHLYDWVKRAFNASMIYMVVCVIGLYSAHQVLDKYYDLKKMKKLCFLHLL